MKRIIFTFALCVIALCGNYLAYAKEFPNKINDTHFINGGYLDYDLNSYKYNKKYDTYSIDVMEELDPGGDIENIKCPYGEGYITHVISSTKYSPKHKFFKAKYKGFMCSVGEYEYENSRPTEFHYNYKGVYYDNNPAIINSDINTIIDKEQYILGLKTLIKIRNLDTYEPVPKYLQDKYIKNIPENLITNYQIDMAKALKHVLNDKITYNNMTLKQMLLDFNKKSDNIYQQYLKDENDEEQNKVYIKKLEEMNGTISLYPNVIIEEVQPVIDKYCLGIEPGSESDIFLYKYYIEKYQVKYSKELKELIQLKEYTFTKIYLYQLKISNKI